MTTYPTPTDLMTMTTDPATIGSRSKNNGSGSKYNALQWATTDPKTMNPTSTDPITMDHTKMDPTTTDPDPTTMDPELQF